jgi:MFS family permease
VANLLSNLVFGRLSRRVDNQRVFLSATLSGVIMSFLVLMLTILAKPLNLSPMAASIWLIPVFFLSGIRATGIGISANSLLLNIAPPQERSVVIGFTQSFLGVVLLVTGLSGGLVGWFGLQFLVTATMVTHFIAMIIAVKIIDTQGISYLKDDHQKNIPCQGTLQK